MENVKGEAEFLLRNQRGSKSQSGKKKPVPKFSIFMLILLEACA